MNGPISTEKEEKVNKFKNKRDTKIKL